MLWLVGGMRRWRRSLLRHKVEQQHLDRWYDLALDHACKDYSLAVEILSCRRLIKGYSDTHVRAQSKFDRVLSALPMLKGRSDAADWLRRLREAALKDEKGDMLDGVTAFKLYDTYGFPYDLTEDALRARGLGVDRSGFDAAMAEQKAAARAAWKGSGEKASDELWFDLAEELGATEFTGYSGHEGEGVVLAILTADCLPVLFCADDGSEVGAAHAGWRGLCAGVLEHTLERMRRQTQSDDWLAWLGRRLGRRHLKSARRYGRRFSPPRRPMNIGSTKAAFHPQAEDGKYLADLYALARLRLRRAVAATSAAVSAVPGAKAGMGFTRYRRDGRTGAWHR